VKKIAKKSRKKEGGLIVFVYISASRGVSVGYSLSLLALEASSL
jgi:hypothetical protein